MTKLIKEICYNNDREVIVEKVVELRKRTIDILEKTKKDITKYAEERKKVNQYFVDSLQVDNLKEWEEFLITFEKLVKGG